MTEELVSHPAGGIYLSKFMAGIVSTIVAAAMVGGFGNLWYLNRKAIENDLHIATVNSSTATLPGALSRREWELERQLIAVQLREINAKLDALAKNGNKL